MTSQKDQIQTLITDIDSVLQKTTPRLPWVVSGEIAQQRQVLERVRNYLVAVQRRQIASEGFGQADARPDLLAHDIYYQPAPSTYPSPQASQPEQQGYDHDALSAQQMLQAIVQEMGYLRANLMQPLQADLEGLRQQRETLVQEIRQLEAQRQTHTRQLPEQQQLITEFLQALMSRLQETLPQQVAQSLRSSNQQSLPAAYPYPNELALAGSAPSVITTSDAPAQGLGNIQVSQASSDELLIRLDSTLSIVFESLQRNVQAYQESLSQGLDKMHSMGQQGEMMFTALISHLAQQLGRETSSYLQPSAPAERELQRSTPSIAAPTSNPLPTQPTVQPLLNPPVADASQPFTLPFPGTEIADRFADASASATPQAPIASVDTAIDSWLRTSGASASPDVDLELAALNLEGFDLSQLAAQDVNALLELDATLYNTNLPFQPILSPTPPAFTPPTSVTPTSTTPTTTPPTPATAEAPPAATSAEDTADIDAALKLLEQLSSELQQPASVADADAQIDRMLSHPTALAGDASTAGIPDDARDELDEFYESLFGADAIAPPTPATPTQVTPDVPPAIAQPTAAPISEPVSEPVVAPAAVAPSASQPISVLPAETQVPGTLVEPSVPAPTVATVTDPTLGWHLPTAPLVAPAEPDIPAALLEDELLAGWDLADAESAAPAAMPATDDLLSGWVAAGDRAAQPLATPSTPATASSTASGDQGMTTDASLVVPPAVPPTQQSETSQADVSHDEINTLTDLFGDPAFDAPTAAEAPPAIAALPVEPIDHPLVQPPASPTGRLQPDSPTQGLPSDLTDGYLTDDRYTPASPDEDLLSLDEPDEGLASELWLDESTLSRLSEDLFNLEDPIDSVTPPYSSSDASPPPLFEAATVPSESPPIASESTLDAWSDASLDDFALNLDDAPTNESTPANESLPIDAAVTEVAVTLPPTDTSLPSDASGTIAAPSDTFTLEGVDDLFADTPVVPPVTPIAPPVSSAELPTFTLEGMDDIFADSPPGDQSIAAAPAAEPLFTLEGIDDLFTDEIATSTDVPTAFTPTEPLFTLEGVDDLFTDELVVSTSDLPVAATSAEPLPFTLEGVDELFADMPSTAPIPSDPTMPSAIEAAFGQLPESDRLLAETDAPPLTLTQPDAVAAFTLEQVGNLFIELPEAEAPVQAVALPSSLPEDPVAAPFTLEQVGDLFIEVPSEAALDERSTTTAPQPSSLTPSLPPAPLDQVDVAANAPAAGVDVPDVPLPTSEPASEPSALEQAFASLLGAFDDPLDAAPADADPTDSTPPAPEKKKEMS